jgi:hypothetical protein
MGQEYEKAASPASEARWKWRPLHGPFWGVAQGMTDPNRFLFRLVNDVWSRPALELERSLRIASPRM